MTEINTATLLESLSNHASHSLSQKPDVRTSQNFLLMKLLLHTFSGQFRSCAARDMSLYLYVSANVSQKPSAWPWPGVVFGINKYAVAPLLSRPLDSPR